MPEPPSVSRRLWARRRIPITIAGVTAVLSALCLKSFPIAWAGIGLVSAAGALAAAVTLRRPWPAAAFFALFNVAVVALALAAAELYLSLRPDDGLSYSNGYNAPHDVLGFAPVPDNRGRSSKRDGARLLYDVTYSIGSDGLRVAPPTSGPGSEQCALFFGGSFAFGEGLEDHETLPYQAGERSGGSLSTYNFGFHGYGPHHMLAALEGGIVEERVRCRPRVSVYQAIVHHVDRVAGKVPFAVNAPRYELTPDGEVVLDGRFGDDRSRLDVELDEQLGKSAIYRTLRDRKRPLSDEDVRLYLGIVRDARDRLSSLYPGIEFHVLLWLVWAEEEAEYRALADGLADLGIPVHLVEHVLPSYEPGSPQYVLGPGDRHPNAHANRILADYVLDRIVPPTTGIVTP